MHRNSLLIKIQPDATVCRYLFTAKSLYMFRVSQHPSSGVIKSVTECTCTRHGTRLPDVGLRTETFRSNFSVLMCKFYTSALLGYLVSELDNMHGVTMKIISVY